MPSPAATGIYLGDGGTLTIVPTAAYTPKGNQALIKVQYSAINPADLKHAYVGIRNSIAGYEHVGEVIEVGNTSSFKVGQTVFGAVLFGNERERHLGAHQDYPIADGTQTTWLLPSHLTPESAVSQPICVGTAIDSLFNTLPFGFPAASLPGRHPKDIPLLIWGGASGVGSAALQVAQAAGFAPIFATASAKNHAALLEAGATKVFDYASATVVDDIRQAAEASGKELNVVLDAVGAGLPTFGSEYAVDVPTTSPALATACLTGPEASHLKASVLPVYFDTTWRFCVGIRPMGDHFMLGEVRIPQDEEFPRRIKGGLDWWFRELGGGEEGCWKDVLALPVAYGAEKAIEEIKRVSEGRASREKVLIGRPL